MNNEKGALDEDHIIDIIDKTIHIDMSSVQNTGSNLTVSLSAYLTKFQWEMAKFPIKQSLRGIVEAISQQTSQIENDLKAKAQTYNNLKSNLANMERKQT